MEKPIEDFEELINQLKDRLVEFEHKILLRVLIDYKTALHGIKQIKEMLR